MFKDNLNKGVSEKNLLQKLIPTYTEPLFRKLIGIARFFYYFFSTSEKLRNVSKLTFMSSIHILLIHTDRPCLSPLKVCESPAVYHVIKPKSNARAVDCSHVFLFLCNCFLLLFAAMKLLSP